jgi:hypothetical protein
MPSRALWPEHGSEQQDPELEERLEVIASLE